jgi:hypothetical protein
MKMESQAEQITGNQNAEAERNRRGKALAFVDKPCRMQFHQQNKKSCFSGV